MSLPELLPLIDTSSWKHVFDEIQGRVIQPGHDLRITWEKKAWIRHVVGVVNNPYTIIEHNIYGGKQISISYYQLLTAGIITPMPAGAYWLQKYDVVNNIYVACYSPVPPQEVNPNPNTYIAFIAPTVDPLTGAPIVTPTVMSLLYDSVIVLDEEKFRESLRGLSTVLTEAIHLPEVK